jgi:predicted tellurium resistance membrane protein TerC
METWLPGITDPETWLAFVSLAAMEIVLGIDNIVFISILTGKLPEANRARVAKIGIALAMIMRIALLFSITWVMSLTTPLFTVLGHGMAGKHLVLLGGGLFLVAKATTELHGKVQGTHEAGGPPKTAASVGAVLAQILALDVVFSLDSVITAVGMVEPNEIWVMVLAVVVAVGVMLAFSTPVTRFVERHPTIKVLALAFLILIGVMLIAEGVGQHISKGYIYFAMSFALAVEMVNLRARRHAAPPVPPTAAGPLVPPKPAS